MCPETFRDHSLFRGRLGHRSESPQKEEEEEEEDSSQKVRQVRRGDIIGEINTINLHILIWGDQYQPSISKLPSSGQLNLGNFNILLTLFHLNERANFDCEILLTRWSTQHLVPTVDLRSPYHFPRIEFITFCALVQSTELFETTDLSLVSSKPPNFLSD